MSEFYCYRHIRTDTNQPFYIGIGKNTTRRPYARAFAFNKTRRSDYWGRVFDKCDGKIEVDVLYESESHEEIVKKEIEFIKLYGKIRNGGTLVNLTDGGDGTFGAIRSPETIEKQRQKLIGVPKSEECRLNISKAKKGVKRSPEAVKKSADAQRGQKRPDVAEKSRQRTGWHHTEESKLSISEKKKGKPGHTPTQETKDAIRKANTGRIFSDEHRENLRQANLGKKVSPEHIEKLRVSSTGRIKTPETCAKLSASLMGHPVSEEARAKMRNAQVLNPRKKDPITGKFKKKE